MEDRDLVTKEIAQEGAFDPQSPTSLINLVPPAIKEHLLRSQNFFLQDHSVETIRNNIKKTNEYEVVNNLRQSFWLEYNRALDSGRKMQMTRVWQGITFTSSEFYNLLKKDHFAAYIFSRPLRQEVAERDMLESATERMKEILSFSAIEKDNDGKERLNTFTAKIQIDLFKHLDERVQGGIIKQTATKINTLNITDNK